MPRVLILLALAIANASLLSAQNAGNYASRALLMNQCADYAGAADQDYAALADAQHITVNAAANDRNAAISLMHALILNNRTQQMRRVYKQYEPAFIGTHDFLQARALLADSYFFEQDYAEALNIYNRLELDALPSPACEGTNYRYAISLLYRGFLPQAKNIFHSLLVYDKYRDNSRFYLAYISYLNKDYEKALASFRNLPAATAADMGADFYIAQILFAAGNYADVLAMERPLLSAAQKIDGEQINAVAEAYRLLGESANAQGNKSKALSYLRKHAAASADGGTLSARYILGAADYEEGFYTKAAQWMQPVADADDNLGQSALLYLGQCAMKSGDYSAAAINFDKAARMNYDPRVQETALYDYAVATINGGNVPFGSAVDLLEEFSRRFPNSEYSPAVSEYLATIYYREHKYADALSRIEQIAHPSEAALQLKQLSQLNLGIDLLNAGRATEAKKLLQAAALSNADNNAKAQANLWLGEACYKLKEYGSAVSAYDNYLKTTSQADSQRPAAIYNRAYALFQQSSYDKARQAFEQVLNTRQSDDIKADATLRIADTYNFTGNINKALEYYNKARNFKGSNSTDYAIFQAANMAGVLGRTSEKISTLESLLRERPNSSWCSATLAELAEAYQASGNMSAARQAISRLEKEYPESEQLRTASLSMADALADKNQAAEAIDAYENIIIRWPSSRQAQVAAENLQSLCAAQGDIQRYLTFIKSVPQAPQPDAKKIASLAYQSAVNAVERDPKNLAPLEAFVADYPTAADAPNALVELIDGYVAKNQQTKAIEAADKLLKNYPDSEGVPTALLTRGRLLQATDKTAAAEAYSQLLNRYGRSYARQAYSGLLASAATDAKRIEYANALLNLPDITETERTDAQLVKANALYQSGQKDEALALYKSLSSNMRTATGGQAATMLAQIYIDKKQYAQAEQLAQKFTAGGCDDMYWLARGYIALADALYAQNKKSQARQYLEALDQNYPQSSDNIRKMIAQRLSTWK